MDVNYSIAHRHFFSIDGSKNLTSSDQKEKRRSNNRIYRLVSEKRKIRKNVGPLGKEMGDLLIQDMEKANALNDIFASSSTSKSQKPKASLRKTKNCTL